MSRYATSHLSGFYNGYRAAAGRAPRRITVSPDLYEAYELELASAILYNSTEPVGPRCLAFKDMKVFRKCEPWSIEVME
jgi:hypothetical protein